MKLNRIDLSKSLDKRTYKTLHSGLAQKLGELQRRAREAGVPVVIVFEGWDAAGKGTLINKLILALDPRGFNVHPTNPPTEEERLRPFLWRFWTRTPARGRIAVFDRSWYGRVMVERVEKFCAEAEWKRAYREINEMEQQWVRFGAILVKFWLHIDKEIQLARFTDRQNTPYKKWKITDEDWRNREKWGPYKAAVDEMLARTSTACAPWTIVEANCKLHARVKALTTVIEAAEKRLSD